MKTSVKLYASLAALAVVVTLVVVVSFWAFRQIEDTNNAKTHSKLVLDKAELLLAELIDAETGQRGYTITGDEIFLEPYLKVHDHLVSDLKSLRLVTLDNAAQEHLTTLSPLVEAKLVELAQVIVLRRNHDMAAAVDMVSRGRGKQLMDAIRFEINSVIQIEKSLVMQHDETFRLNMRNLFTAIVGASVFSMVLALLFVYWIYREQQHRLSNVIHSETQHLLAQQLESNANLKIAHTSLLASEEQLGVTLNSMGDALIVTDSEARVTRMNPVAEKLSGWTEAEATGRPVADVFKIISKETREPSTNPVMQTLTHGTIQGLANHTVLISRDARETDIADSCAPIRDRDGKVNGAVLVFRDVSKEYIVQQALRDREELIQAILTTAADGIVTFRADGDIIEKVNPASEHMFGYAVTELIGQKFSVLIPELDNRFDDLEYYRATDKARASGLQREVTGKRKDGSTFAMEIAAREMWLAGERYFTAILRDISTRRIVEAERNRLDLVLHDKSIELEKAKLIAEKANLAKSEFLSSMSHELRSPLNAILGFAQLMESSVPPPTLAQKSSIDQILKGGWYLLELINEVLDLALIESGTQSLSTEPVSLADVLTDCRAMIASQAQKNGIRMSFPEVDVDCYINADRTRVKQVFINLLSNAIKYNRVGGLVEVGISIHSSNRIRVSVRDTGEGLSAEKIGQLFQPFNRLGQEVGATQGTGIGLVVSKRLIELMHGEIGVQSTPGVGSVFWIELSRAVMPVLAAHSPQATPHTVEHAMVNAIAHGPQHTLLYVEDNPANLMLVTELIARRPDIRLLSATNGIRGIEIARAELPDVILMDINLPGISGIQALKMLASDATTAHIPVIALSANAMPRDIEKGMEAGFFRYLTKPIKVNLFMETLDLALAFAAPDDLKNKEQT